MKKTIALLLAFMLVLISGCSGTEESDEGVSESTSVAAVTSEEEDDGFQMETMTTEDGIVYYLKEQSDREDEPVMVLLHGLGGSHADLFSVAESLYNMGYAVVTFDLYGHAGDEYEEDIYINEMIATSAAQVEQILTSLDGENICDAERYGIYAVSLGGMTAFYLAAFGEKLPSLIISIASSPDIESVFSYALNYLRSTWSVEDGTFVYATAEEQELLLQWAEENNPADETERLVQIPILMVNGAEDQYMNIDAVRVFQSEIEALGGTIQVCENEHGKHDQLGDYHNEEVVTALTEYLPT